VERHGRHREIELRRECKRSVRADDHVGVLPGEEAAPGGVGVGADELRAGGLRLEQLDRLGKQL